MFRGETREIWPTVKKEKEKNPSRLSKRIVGQDVESLSNIGVDMFIITLTIPNSAFRVEFCDLLTYCHTEILRFKYERIIFDSLRTLSYLWLNKLLKQEFL